MRLCCRLPISVAGLVYGVVQGREGARIGIKTCIGLLENASELSAYPGNISTTGNGRLSRGLLRGVGLWERLGPVSEPHGVSPRRLSDPIAFADWVSTHHLRRILIEKWGPAGDENGTTFTTINPPAVSIRQASRIGRSRRSAKNCDYLATIPTSSRVSTSSRMLEWA